MAAWRSLAAIAASARNWRTNSGSRSRSRRTRLRHTRCAKPPGPRRTATYVSAMPPTPRRDDELVRPDANGRIRHRGAAPAACAHGSRREATPRARARGNPGSLDAELAACYTGRDGHAETPQRIIVELCRQFYGIGWATGTGGGVSIRQDGRIYMAPSGVQKERLAEEDIFELDESGQVRRGAGRATSS